MWSQLPIRSLMDMQRRETVQQAGAKILSLHEDGYSVEADQMLDDLAERIQRWAEEAA